MNNLTLAVEVAIFVRDYLRQNELRNIDTRDMKENHENITRQIRNITKLR